GAALFSICTLYFVLCTFEKAFRVPIRAVGGIDISRSQQPTISVSHLHLQCRKIPEMRRVIRGKRVPADILPPRVGGFLAPAGRLA
ncbi:MAG: hypothetical protein KBT28_07385, partial [Bacteroidales bacterium]|nr:hypothetical protein [Candidatus Colimorpha merdihippi]